MVLICLNTQTSLGNEAVARMDARGEGTTAAHLEVVAEGAALVESGGRGPEVEVAAATVFFGRGMGISMALKAFRGLGKTTL